MIRSAVSRALRGAAGSALCVVMESSVLARYLIKSSAAIRELIAERWLADEIQMVTAPELVAELEGVVERPALRRFIRPEESQALQECRRGFLTALLCYP